MRRVARDCAALVRWALGPALGLALGCSPQKVAGPDLPPDTRLFVQYDATDGTSHTVNHIVHLYWFGSDPDGFVQKYEYRFLDPGGPPNPPWPDTPLSTTQSDMVFTLQAPSGSATPTFEIRAVDDHGLADPTPAIQNFSFSNQAPSLALVSPPVAADSTYPAITLNWTAVDADGDANKLLFRIWLDGNEANARVFSGRSASLVPDDFLQGGKLRAGPRQVSVQPLDDGGRAGDPATATWYVRAPVPDTLQRPRLLIVDDISRSQNAVQNRQYDTLFINTALRQMLPAGSFEILRLEFTQPFRSAEDVKNTFGLYDAVAWYRGTQRSQGSPHGALITNYWSGIDAYLAKGGRMFLEGLDLVEGLGAPGLIPETALNDRLDGATLYLHLNRIPPPDSIADWGVAVAYNDTVGGVPVLNPAVLHSSVYQDSFRVSIASGGGIRSIGVRDTSEVALWARSRVITPRQANDSAVAITVEQPHNGRLVATCMPLFAMNGYGNWFAFLGHAFHDLGIEGP